MQPAANWPINHKKSLYKIEAFLLVDYRLGIANNDVVGIPVNGKYRQIIAITRAVI
jgi:hypothetical protein